MSKPDSDEFGLRKPTLPTAVGLVASNDLGVIKNIVRAREKGLTVIIADSGDCDPILNVAEKYDARIVEFPGSVDSIIEYREHFAAIAREISLPGIIVPKDSRAPVDFERSIVEFDEDAYVDGAVSLKADENLEVLAAIPAYNEETAIGDVVREAKQYADSVIVVDDGSSDDTVPKAKEAGAVVVEHEENSGYGAALRTAFQEAAERQPKHLVILDGDGQHDPSDIPEAVRVQEQDEAEIVIGSRFADGSETELPLYRRFGLAVVNVLTNLSMGVVRSESRVGDTQSGFRSYDQQAIKSLSQDDSIGSGMSASTDILYHGHQQGYNIAEFGTTIDYNVEDASTHNPVSHGVSLVGNILRTIERERPITVLGVPGFLSAFVGLGFGYWTFSNYIQTETFPIGIAIVSATFLLSGVFSAFTAIILHSLNAYRQENLPR